MDFCDRLKILRKREGYTQCDFAERIGVTQSTVSGWELGRNEPIYAVLRRISQTFGVSADYLIGTEGGATLPPDLANALPEIAEAAPGMLLDGEPINQYAAAVASTMLIGTLDAVKSAQKRFKASQRE